jgi:UDP-GlcNAc:undecaprenyl-phosphate/decaprenyl-phosphate GlcNAc-1-phosphate transferase
VREYALVFCVAAAVTFLLTPVVRVVAMRWGAVARPRDRDVHAIPTPRLGGVAMYAGIAAALLIAHLMPTLQRTYVHGSETSAVLVAGGFICLLGVVDDRWEIDSLTKLAGQVFTSGVMVLLGVQLLQVFVPIGQVGTVSFARNDSVGLTVVLCLLAINAMNFIDGLDGLAAGVSAIGAVAFFAYSYHLAKVGYGDVAFAPTLLSAVLAGACVGFLPHNFSPARIFMGDSGSMLVGLMLAASAITASSGADPQSFDTFVGPLPLAIPLLIPLVVLAVPLVDLLMAVFRRVKAGRSPFAPDKMHLHHRLLEIGHSHRRAVLIIYFWSALLASGGVAMAITDDPFTVLSAVAVLAAVALLLSSVPRLRALRRTAG